jgi:SAM-dependent methyltransferase
MDILSHGYSRELVGVDSNQDTQAAMAALQEFELGRFLIANRGLNGYWTSYVLLHPDRGRETRLSSDGSPLTELESWILDRCPIFLATQERFRIFRELTQPCIVSGLKAASVPSGLMDDLLTLDYSRASNVTLTAVDLDSASLEKADENHRRIGAPVNFERECRDAWDLGASDRWDLVTSNGLNIYVEDDERCVELYRSVASSLRSGGIFIVSFITPPEAWQPYSAADLEKQRLLFRDVLDVKWQCVRDEEQTRRQLEAAGFEIATIQYDRQRMFPAVVARRRKS